MWKEKKNCLGLKKQRQLFGLGVGLKIRIPPGLLWFGRNSSRCPVSASSVERSGTTTALYGSGQTHGVPQLGYPAEFRSHWPAQKRAWNASWMIYIVDDSLYQLLFLQFLTMHSNPRTRSRHRQTTASWPSSTQCPWPRWRPGSAPGSGQTRRPAPRRTRSRRQRRAG
jgi:hypothetical protein